MKKLLLLLVLFAACEKDIVQEITCPPGLYWSEVNQSCIINDQALDASSSTRKYFPDQLSTALETRTWDTPFWIQDILGGYGLHYGDNPNRGDASTAKDNWLRGKAYLFIGNDNKPYVVMKHYDYWAIIYLDSDGPKAPLGQWNHRALFLKYDIEKGNIDAYIVNRGNKQ